MAQFDVCRNEGSNADQYPYLIILQSELTVSKKMAVVAPLDSCNHYDKTLRVCPQITIEDENLLIIVPQLAAVPLHLLGEVVGGGEHLRTDILSALDRLFTGIG